MEILKDKHNVIITIDHPLFRKSENEIEDTIISFFENLINNNTFIFNNNLIIHYFYKSNKYLIPSNIITLENKIINILNNKIRGIRNNFRKLNKVNNLKIIYVINFIKQYRKILSNIETIMMNIRDKTKLMYDHKKKWGTSKIVEKGIYNLYNNLLTDFCILNTLEKAIKANDNVYEYINFLKVFDNYGCTYVTIVEKIDNILVDMIPKNIYNGTSYDMKLILDFRDTFQYYKHIKYKYNYIINDKKLNISFEFEQLLEKLLAQLNNINKTLSIDNFIKFLITYKYELNSVDYNVSKCKNTNNYLQKILCENFHKITKYSPKSIENFINYGNTILSVTDNFGYKYKKNKNQTSQYLNSIISCIGNSYIEKDNLLDTVKFVTKSISNNILNNNMVNCMFSYLYISTLVSKNDTFKLFIKYLEKNLIMRIVYHNSKITNELLNYDMMESYIDFSDLFEYRNILSDYSKSQDNKTPNNMSMLVITPDIWKINTTAGYLEYGEIETGPASDKVFQKSFSRHINPLIENYYDNNKDKFLLLHLHLGSVDITFKANNQDTKIRMLPIQMLFFELFDSLGCGVLDDETIKYAFSRYLKYYKNSEIILNNIINSFINKHIIVKDIHNNYYVNKNYNNDNNLDLIKEYNKLANMEVEVDMVITKELAHSKETILSSVINHLLKANESVKDADLDTLFRSSKDKLKSININRDLFDSTIQKMIEKDYIEKCSKTNVCKLCY